MTIISIIAIFLAVLRAFLFGRSAVVSDQRNNSNKQLKSEVAKLNHRLDRIANSSEFDRCYEIEEDEEMEFRIVGSTEANSLQNKISNESPVGQALLGKKVGDVVDVETQVGIIQYKVLEIQRVS